MSSDCVKRKQQDNDEGADFSDDGTSQNKIAEMKKRKAILNKIRCKRYRDKKKKMLSSQIFKGPIRIVKEEELIKRRREYDKQKSQRYRDKRKLKMFSDSGKKVGQEDCERMDFFDDGTSQSKIADIKKRREAQNKIRCQVYRDKNKKVPIK